MQRVFISYVLFQKSAGEGKTIKLLGAKMHKAVAFIPCPQQLVFLHDPDIHLSTSKGLCRINRMLHQRFANALVPV